jgi:PAS domain S-box-containing protein
MVIAPAHRLVGTHLRDWVAASQKQHLQALHDVALKGRDGAGEGAELQLLRDALDPFGLTVSVQVLPVMEGKVVKALHWVLRDVNPQIDSAFQLQKPLVEFERVSECVFMTDASGLILTVNAAFTRVTGYTAAEVLGRNPRFLGSGLQDAAFYKDFWQELQSAGSWQGQIFNRKKNGDVYSEWLKVNASRDTDGHVLSYTAVFYDLSRTAAPELQHQVHTLPQPLSRLI